jgi:hypothetical protein
MLGSKSLVCSLTVVTEVIPYNLVPGEGNPVIQGETAQQPDDSKTCRAFMACNFKSVEGELRNTFQHALFLSQVLGKSVPPENLGTVSRLEPLTISNHYHGIFSQSLS